MARSPGEISQGSWEKLDQFMLSHEADVYGVPYEERVSAWQAERKRRGKRRPHELKETIANLPETFAIANMTMADAFAMWGVELRWPTEQARRVADNMDVIGLTAGAESSAEYLVQMIETFPAEHWNNADFGNMRTRASGRTNPFMRVSYIYKTYYVSAKEREKLLAQLPPETAKKFTLVKAMNEFDIVEYPALSVAFNLPLHWILGYPREVLCLGKTPVTEAFMDVYLRLAQRHRDLFEHVVAKQIEAIHNAT